MIALSWSIENLIVHAVTLGILSLAGLGIYKLGQQSMLPDDGKENE
jgi:hypothetical protein